MEEKEVQKVSSPAIRFTPLNLVTALSLFGAYSFLSGGFELKAGNGMKLLLAGLCITGGVVSVIADLIFRKSLSSLKKVWIVEGSFIAFTIVLILIIKTIIF